MNISKAGWGQVSRFIFNSWESIVAAGVLVIVFTLELNAVSHGGAQGQDFYYHCTRMLAAAKDPIKFVGASSVADPPLYHLCADIVYRLNGPATLALRRRNHERRI